MAGGKGTRMGAREEKPMIVLEGKPIIEHVIDTLLAVEEITRIVVACSPNTPRTLEHIVQSGIRAQGQLTGGNGYHEDMKEAIRCAKISGPTLVTVSDIPLVTSDIVRGAIAAYNDSNKQSLCILLPASSSLNSDVQPFESNGISVVATGLNIVNASKITEPRLTQLDLIIDRPRELLNTNTKKDIELARSILTNDNKTDDNTEKQ